MLIHIQHPVRIGSQIGNLMVLFNFIKMNYQGKITPFNYTKYEILLRSIG